jgi:hypothetical protein
MFLTNKIAGNKLITKKKILIVSSGMTLISPTSYVDDSNYAVGDIGFDFPFYGTTYRNNIYVGTNSYVTFGFGSNLYSGITLTNPGRGIFIAAADNGILGGIFTIKDIPGQIFRIIFFGTNRTPATEQNIYWETTLYLNGNIRIKTGRIVPRSPYLTAINKGDGVKFTNFASASNQDLLYGYNSPTDNYILL